MVYQTVRRGLSKARKSLSNCKKKTIFKELKAGQTHKYEEKVLPYLLREFHEEHLKPLPTKSPFALRHALNVRISSVVNLSVKPGDRHFIFWFFISSYFPLLAACLGPLANMISLIGLIEHWKMDIATGQLVQDQARIIILNAFSFALGVLGNISLLLNFSGTLGYLVTQSVSIFCWFSASVILMVGIILANYEFIQSPPLYDRTEGFWFAVFTTFYYFCCAAILLVNFIGYKLKKYPASFNLDSKQRSLMVYTICFAVWSAISAIVMSHLINDLTYGSSLYFCIVTFLTIGFGDIVPHTPGSKAFTLIMSLVGVLIMGLIIAMITRVVLSSTGPTFFWHQIEKERVKALKKLEEKKIALTPERSFHRMRLIRRRAKIKRLNISLASTGLLFMLFWFIGAAVFHFIETWSYFNAVYFCFLSFLTTGYGDFAPTTPLGRVFFISWAVSAVPLMTILISNVGDKLFQFTYHISHLITKILFINYYKEKMARRKKEMSEEHVDETESTIENEDEEDEEDEEASAGMRDEDRARIDPLSSFLKPDIPKDPQSSNMKRENWRIMKDTMEIRMKDRKESYINLLNFLNKLKPLIADSLEDPFKRYDHDQWSEILENLQDNNEDEKESEIQSSPTRSASNDDYFWLSDESPLRLPIKEPNYLILKIFLKIEADLNNLIETEIQDIQRLKRLENILSKQ